MLRVAQQQDPSLASGYGCKMAASQQDYNMNGLPGHYPHHHPHHPHGHTRVNPFTAGPHPTYHNVQIPPQRHQHFRVAPNSDGVYAEILPVNPKSPLHSRYGTTDTWINPAFNSPVHCSNTGGHHGNAAPLYASPTHLKRSSPAASSSFSGTSPAHSAISSNSSNAAVSFFTRAAQKLSRKRKKKESAPEMESVSLLEPKLNSHMYLTNFHERLTTNPPQEPPSLHRSVTRIMGTNKVKVILRISPVNSHMTDAAQFMEIDQNKRQVILHHPTTNYTAPSQRRSGDLPRRFEYDGVVTQHDSMAELCSQSLLDIIQAVVAGLDGCVFCYGHARLGKTYSMIGTDDGPQTLGIIPTAISWLYRLIDEQRKQTGNRFSVRVSAVEITGKQETLKDLLADVAPGVEVEQAPGVYLRDDPIHGSQLQNQSELRAPTAREAAHYLDAAITARTTPQQEDDARNSHLLFTFHVYQWHIERGSGAPNLAPGPVKGGVDGGRSRLHLLDLGSCSKSSRDGGLTLAGVGNVLLALFKGQRQIPSRDSKLSQLIKESLGSSSCRTCMIAHVSPLAHSYNETLGVMQLAAKIHRTKPRKSRGGAYPSSSDGSSSADSISIRRYRGIRMGTVQGFSSLSDPSSSEMSCDTVIYTGATGRALSDQELTDNEHPPSPGQLPPSPGQLAGRPSLQRLMPRTVPNLNRSRSHSGDESSDAEKVSVVSKSSGDGKLSNGAISANRIKSPSQPLNDQSNFGFQGHNQSPLSPNRVCPPYMKQPPSPVVPATNDASHIPSSQPPRRSRLHAVNTGPEQWIDGPYFSNLAHYPIPEEPDNIATPSEEQWIDGPKEFCCQANNNNCDTSSKVSSQTVASKQTSDLSTQTVLSSTKLGKLKEHVGVDSLRHLPRPNKSISPFVADWLDKHSGISSSDDENKGKSRRKSKTVKSKEGHSRAIPPADHRSSSPAQHARLESVQVMVHASAEHEDTTVQPAVDGVRSCVKQQGDTMNRIQSSMDDVIADIDNCLTPGESEAEQVVPHESSEEVEFAEEPSKRSRSSDHELADTIMTNLFMSNRESVYELQFDEQLEEACKGSMRNSFHSEADSWSSSSLLREASGLCGEVEEGDDVHVAVSEVEVPSLDVSFKNQSLRNPTLQSGQTHYSNFPVSTIDSGNCTQTETSFATMESSKAVNHDTSTGVSTLDSRPEVEQSKNLEYMVYSAITSHVPRCPSSLRKPDGASNPNIFLDPSRSPASVRHMLFKKENKTHELEKDKSATKLKKPSEAISKSELMIKTPKNHFSTRHAVSVQSVQTVCNETIVSSSVASSQHPSSASKLPRTGSAKDKLADQAGKKKSLVSRLPLCPTRKTNSPSPPATVAKDNPRFGVGARSKPPVAPPHQRSSRGKYNCDSDSGIDSGMVCHVTARSTPSSRAQTRGVSLLSASSGHYSDASSGVSQFNPRPSSAHAYTPRKLEVCTHSSGYESTKVDSEITSSSTQDSTSESERNSSLPRRKINYKRSKSAPSGACVGVSHSAPGSCVTSPVHKSNKLQVVEITHYEIEDVSRMEKRRREEVKQQEVRKRRIAELFEEQERLKKEYVRFHKASEPKHMGLKLFEERHRTDDDFLHRLEKETETFRKKVTGSGSQQSKLARTFGFARRSSKP